VVDEDKPEKPRDRAAEKSEEGLSTKLGLAIFSFVLGLLATVITNAYLRERREIAYSVAAEPIASVRKATTNRPDLDAALKTLQNAVTYRIRLENTGDLPVPDFAVRVVLNPEARIESKSVSTSPTREVPWAEEQTGAANELRLSGITLDRTQSLTLTTLVESPVATHVDVYPFLAKSGVVNWKRGGTSESLSLQTALLRLVWLYVLALVLPGLIAIVPQAGALFFFGNRSRKGNAIAERFMMGTSAGQLIGSLVRFYLYISMLAPAGTVIKLLMQGRT
jgi:hypothetical protein